MNKRFTIGLFGIAALVSIAAGARGIVAQTSTTGPTFYRNGTEVPYSGQSENPYGQPYGGENAYGQPGSDPAAAYEQYEGGFDPNEQYNEYTEGYESYDPLSGSEWPAADQGYPSASPGIDPSYPGFQGGTTFPDANAPAGSDTEQSDIDALYEEYMQSGDQPAQGQMEQTEAPQDLPMQPEPEEELKSAAPRGFGPSMITWVATGVAIVIGVGMTLFMMKKKPAAPAMQVMYTQPPVAPAAPLPSTPTLQYGPPAPSPTPTPPSTTLQAPPPPPPVTPQPPAGQ